MSEPADAILITGAGTGLGLEMSLHLAAQGYRVFATIPLDEQRAHVAGEAAARGVTLRLLLLDVTDPASIADAVTTVMAEHGNLYGLINNAGISLRGYFEDCDDDEIRRVYEVNVFGGMNVTRAVLPHMRAAGRGRIIFISSVGGRIASMARTAYCSSKFAVEGFAESLYQELLPLGIRVSVVAPAIIKNERWTVHRGLARRADDPAGPYHAWFVREEALADELVNSSPTTNRDVALAVEQLLADARPRLHTVVGRRANLAVLLRRLLPETVFERALLARAVRRVTGES